jgi:hypothetical protein
MFDDLRSREPTREELRNWSRQLQTRKREDVALAVIREGPGPQPPAKPVEADYFAELGNAIRRVDERLDDLSEDIVEELEGKRDRDLIRRTEAVINDLHAFHRVARPGIPRERMERAFNQFDRSLDKLLDDVRRVAGERGALRRSADRVARADERLHRAFFANAPTPDRPGGGAILREAEALIVQSTRLRQTVGVLLPDVAAGTRIRRNLDAVVERAERLRDGIKAGADIRELRRSFTALIEPWGAAVRDINTLPPAGNYYTLRQQAQRVEQIGTWLQRQLGAEIEIPFISTVAGPNR